MPWCNSIMCSKYLGIEFISVETNKLLPYHINNFFYYFVNVLNCAMGINVILVYKSHTSDNIVVLESCLFLKLLPRYSHINSMI